VVKARNLIPFAKITIAVKTLNGFNALWRAQTAQQATAQADKQKITHKIALIQTSNYRV
jgi:hypothetical protein